MSPRARCIVPTRHPENAKPWSGFAKTFTKARAKHLPEWSELSAFGNHYFLTVDSLLPASEVGKILKVGDSLEIVGVKSNT